MSGEVAEVAGVKVPLGPHLSEVMRAKLVRGKYESREIRAVRSTLKATDIVLELGAGLGVVSAICAKIVGSPNVFSVEANPDLEQPIRRLYAVNSVAPHLEIGVLRGEPGSAILHVAEEFWASSTLTGVGGTKEVEVPALRYADVHKAVRPSFVIIDVEGAELELVRHIVLGGVRTIVAELHPDLIGEDGCKQVVDRFRRAGFRVNRPLSRKNVVVLHRRWSRDYLEAQLVRMVARMTRQGRKTTTIRPTPGSGLARPGSARTRGRGSC